MNYLHQIIAMFILALSGKLCAQENMLPLGNVIFDTTTFYKRNYNLTPKSIFHSSNKIEIRFERWSSFDKPSFLILAYNNSWTAYHYYVKKGSDSLVCDTLHPSVNLDTLFSQLVKKHVFSLPDQKKLEMNDYYYDIVTGEIMGRGGGVIDGVTNIVEFKIGDNLFRRYTFSHPEYYSEIYTGVPELKDYMAIEALFLSVLTP
ncbi:MAG: hypothetical protein MUC87_03775 [Bacteroidia bacterium]|jgi:hypothetical protein|nr:hypothetical protein [Bacteroidia bacterium]